MQTWAASKKRQRSTSRWKKMRVNREDPHADEGVNSGELGDDKTTNPLIIPSTPVNR